MRILGTFNDGIKLWRKFHIIIPTAIKWERLWKYHLPSTLLKRDPFDNSSICHNQKKNVKPKEFTYSSLDRIDEWFGELGKRHSLQNLAALHIQQKRGLGKQGYSSHIHAFKTTH